MKTGENIFFVPGAPIRIPGTQVLSVSFFFKLQILPTIE